MANKTILGYWDIRGLGQSIRFLLAYLGVDYEEKRYEQNDKDWPADKERLNLDFPNLPYLINGTTTLTESRVIMRHLCRIHKPELLGKSLKAQNDAELVDCVMYEFLERMAITAYDNSEEKHKEFKEWAPKKIENMSNFLKGKQWVAGDDITYADFLAYEFLRDYRVYDKNGLDNFPILQAYLSRVESLPAIQEYRKSPTYLEAPIFMKMCKMQI